MLAWVKMDIGNSGIEIQTEPLSHTVENVGRVQGMVFCWECSRKPRCQAFPPWEWIPEPPEPPRRGRDLQRGQGSISPVHRCDSGHTFGALYLPKCDLRRRAPEIPTLYPYSPSQAEHGNYLSWIHFNRLTPVDVSPRKCCWVFLFFFSVTFS